MADSVMEQYYKNMKRLHNTVRMMKGGDEVKIGSPEKKRSLFSRLRHLK